ncbi:DUF1513 domain-containing protein [Magnetococcus sp. PR-3]|uniref:DUF1513 domain-containing protein n=1 Tax=Magnetococcus sp. PR-3 TaxID=3120355 RepID=UPI002FCE557D
MQLTRRQLMLAGGAMLLAPSSHAAVPNSVYLSAYHRRGKGYALAAMDATGHIHFEQALPARGHGMALHPHGHTVVQIARRPGRFLQVVELPSGRVRHALETPVDRHLFGHGVFSSNGRWLYTTEHDYAQGRGVIGIRDAQQNYQQVGEWDSHGVGPHDLAMLADGRTLVVANGGILTHPDTPRAKLNLASMQPSLVYLDTQTGHLLEQHHLDQDLHQNSIRHLAVGQGDRVCFVMQYQGSKRHHPPLVALHQRGEAIQLCSAPAAIQKQMRHYCGSVAADCTGRCFGVSSPKGGLTTFWRGVDGHYLGQVALKDGCGVTATERPGEFLLSSGQGQLQRVQWRLNRIEAQTAVAISGARWDNHMITL